MTMPAPRFHTCIKYLLLIPLSVLMTILFIAASNNGSLQSIEEDIEDIYNFASSNHTKLNQRSSGIVKNPHPFRYTILESDICTKRDPFLLIVVHTAPHHFKARQFIRETWGHRSDLYTEYGAVVVFMMGLSNGSEIQTSINDEHRRYRDIVQENFVDTYKNLTYKAIEWMKWSSVYCKNVSYVLKVDDDIVVNMNNVNKFLRYRRTVNERSTIYCMIWSNLTVHRENSSRWHLSKEDYDAEIYPTYCSGSGYILTRDLVDPLFELSFKTKFFWIDDIYVTGIMAKEIANIKHYDLSGRYILSKKFLTDSFMQSYAMFAHLPGSNNLRLWFWQEMKKAKPYYKTKDKFTNFGDAAIRI